MTQIPVTIARKRLYELSYRVENGETITVTRYGKPWVDLIPYRGEFPSADATEGLKSPAKPRKRPITP
jgi:antitoxin (DNA-binding transcriptional repressor) of toxin-antitoxin stability system